MRNENSTVEQEANKKEQQIVTFVIFVTQDAQTPKNKNFEKELVSENENPRDGKLDPNNNNNTTYGPNSVANNPRGTVNYHQQGGGNTTSYGGPVFNGQPPLLFAQGTQRDFSTGTISCPSFMWSSQLGILFRSRSKEVSGSSTAVRNRVNYKFRKGTTSMIHLFGS